MFMYIFLCWSRDLSSGDKVEIREDTAVVGEADEVGGELIKKKTNVQILNLHLQFQSCDLDMSTNN